MNHNITMIELYECKEPYFDILGADKNKEVSFKFVLFFYIFG